MLSVCLRVGETETCRATQESVGIFVFDLNVTREFKITDRYVPTGRRTRQRAQQTVFQLWQRVYRFSPWARVIPAGAKQARPDSFLVATRTMRRVRFVWACVSISKLEWSAQTSGRTGGRSPAQTLDGRSTGRLFALRAQRKSPRSENKSPRRIQQLSNGFRFSRIISWHSL